METDKYVMDLGETREVTIPPRAVSGLQLLFRQESDSLLEISMKEKSSIEDKKMPSNIGETFPVVYELKAIAKGETKVTFYETQSWNSEFKPIIIKQITVRVR
ncbi:MAG: hypothetical protein QM737_09615 [Ferruginibacter sp.]